jgi:hypothetical protein
VVVDGPNARTSIACIERLAKKASGTDIG